jgi:hypothetical protein
VAARSWHWHRGLWAKHVTCMMDYSGSAILLQVHCGGIRACSTCTASWMLNSPAKTFARFLYNTSSIAHVQSIIKPLMVLWHRGFLASLQDHKAVAGCRWRSMQPFKAISHASPGALSDTYNIHWIPCCLTTSTQRFCRSPLLLRTICDRIILHVLLGFFPQYRSFLPRKSWHDDMVIT